MLVKVECNGREYDELIKQLKEEKISFKTETTKQTLVDYFGPDSNNKEKTTLWFYVVRFRIDAENFI